MSFASNTVVPIDPGQAFVEGYEAYQRADFPVVIGRMQLASAKLPEVGDYALFYLGGAQAKLNDEQDAAESYRRLFTSYPQSILTETAEVDYAQLELAAGQAGVALESAGRVANRTRERGIEEQARLIVAQAAFAQNDFATAYRMAQVIREENPQSATDASARALSYKVLGSHPELKGGSALSYHYREAQLLVREGQADAALKHVRAALALAPQRHARNFIGFARRRRAGIKLEWHGKSCSRSRPVGNMRPRR